MWCDDCGRGTCSCNEEQYIDESNGWNDIWPPVPDDVWVRWVFHSVRSGDLAEAQGKVQPWVLARWFTFASMVEIETDSQIFSRKEDGSWQCFTYPPIPLL